MLPFGTVQKALAGLRRINLDGLRWRVFDAKGQVGILSLVSAVRNSSEKKGEYIRCKPTFLCKLCKLQSGSSDQHPRGMEDWIILQLTAHLGLGNHTFANIPSHLFASLLLDVDLMTQIEVSIVCTERLVCT